MSDERAPRWVAIVGEPGFAELHHVKDLVKALPPGSLVLIGSESAPVENTAARQANCSKLTCARFASTRQRGYSEAVLERDRRMYERADGAVVFGVLSEARMKVLGEAQIPFTCVMPEMPKDATQRPAAGGPATEGAPAGDTTNGPQKRVIAIFDRSNVFAAGDRPKLVALNPVPDPR